MPSSNFKNLVGRRYGRLIILQDTGKRKRRCPIWLCLCTCGKQKEISGNSLRNGSKSCGCLRKENKGRRAHKNSKYSQIFARYRLEAKVRNYTFSLNKEEFINLIRSNCFYCDSFPKNVINYYGKKYYYNGIDRVDNDEGYVLSNCVPCCKLCNSKKKATNVSMIKKAYLFLQQLGKV